MTAIDDRAASTRTPYGWAIRAALLVTLLVAALLLVGVLVTATTVPGILTGNPISTTIETSQPLHTVGHNEYGGTAYVADDDTVIATRVTAEVTDAATSVRIGLAFGPVVWAATGAGVAIALAVGFGGMLEASARVRRASRAFAVAALIGAIGTSVGQILDELARTGLGGVLWHGPSGIHRLGTGAGFTFQFGWLGLAVGLLAIAAFVGRVAADEAAGGVSRPTA